MFIIKFQSQVCYHCFGGRLCRRITRKLFASGCVNITLVHNRVLLSNWSHHISILSLYEMSLPKWKIYDTCRMNFWTRSLQWIWAMQAWMIDVDAVLVVHLNSGFSPLVFLTYISLYMRCWEQKSKYCWNLLYTVLVSENLGNDCHYTLY